MTPLSDYLKTVDAANSPTLEEFHDAVVDFQRVTNMFGARLALELAELDGAHADEASRRAALDPVERGKGSQATLYGALDNATSRTKFLQDRTAQVNLLLTKIRAGVNDLRESQAAVRASGTLPDAAP